MINSFYEALKGAQEWFFGSALLSDPFFQGLVNLFNALLLFSMFYGLIFLPLRWCLSALVKRIKGVNDED